MEDYKALVDAARTGQYDSDTELIDRLADAVEALRAQLDNMTLQYNDRWEPRMKRLVGPWVEVTD